MKSTRAFLLLILLLCSSACIPAIAQVAGTSGANDLVVAQDGKTTTTIVVSPAAGKAESLAAADLQRCIELMSGARPALANTAETIDAALKGNTGVLVVGQAAIDAEPSLRPALDKIAKKNPVLRADAIVVRRNGNRVYMAGTNDESHYYAVSHLLHLWGCRWYLPTELGECIPQHGVLRVGHIDYSYAPPFEIRRGLNRLTIGGEEYALRNFMGSVSFSAHMGSLHAYTQDIVPEGKTFYEVPFAEEVTAQAIAEKIAPLYAKGVGDIPIAVFIQEYSSTSPRDKELKAGIISKYQDMVSSTDAMMVLYNNVAKILREKYPDSKTRLGGISMASTTLPPQRELIPEPSLVMWLVPADIDPNHHMDDPRSPSRQEYRDMMYRWAEIMKGRIALYDYEQPMMVWRDLPNPNYYVFANDVKHYRKAGVLGFSPETRGSLAITFLNVYFRGQLMWNPDIDVETHLNDFYTKFYGPAAGPMGDYWRAIFKAWKETIVTEHEHYLAPAIYTPELVSTLRRHLESAEAIMKPLSVKADLNRNEKLYTERMKLARIGFDILDNYMAMVRAGATEGDYKTAVSAGRRGLANVLALAKFSPTLTPDYNAKADSLEPGGDPAWWPGEVKQYMDLLEYSDGTKGTLIAKTPLEWAFRRDPNDSGLASGWAYKPVDLSYWNANKNKYTVETRKDYPTTQWEMLRTDLYMQAQGVRHPDHQSFTGHAWYRTEVQLTPEQARNKVHLRFPGVFNEGWLYINGHLVAHRPQKALWALNNYAFEWDVDISKHVKPGANSITLRLHNSMYMGGIFRRPFLYRPVGAR